MVGEYVRPNQSSSTDILQLHRLTAAVAEIVQRDVSPDDAGTDYMDLLVALGGVMHYLTPRPRVPWHLPVEPPKHFGEVTTV